MKTHLAWLTILMLIIFMMKFPVVGQDSEAIDCDDLENYILDGVEDIQVENTDSAEYAYYLGDLYTDFALQCGYQPTLDEIDAQVNRTLDMAPLSYIIAASSIGNDVDVALAELESVNGDSFNGQLLYNGLEMGLDGAELGCAACHNGEVAPAIEGTYTRVEEQRLSLPEFEDYTVEQYLVESILHPDAYILPEYASVQMPTNYGGRLDAQQLADLVAYLESQDQLSE